MGCVCNGDYIAGELVGVVGGGAVVGGVGGDGGDDDGEEGENWVDAERKQ